jgi:holo-[acyl-carrier protein] synthase
MTIRIGIDLVSAESVRDSVDIHGPRYLRRVYSEREVSDCWSEPAGIDPQRLAARFAAKEATFKVLRAGDEAVSWRDVEVRRAPSGWVELSLSGQAATLAETARISGLSLSLTHESGYAAAAVIAEIPEPADT